MVSVRSAVFLVLMNALLVSHAAAFDGVPAPDGGKITPEHMTASEALRYGARKYYSGDKAAAVSSLQYAAENGQPIAAWKLGEMYAKGDGVKEDDIKAFQYYSQVVRLHGEDNPNSPEAPFVASAFVALGNYYLDGIGDNFLPQNKARARQIFTHAASYFGDADAQFALGKMYINTNKLLAVRWFNLAAIKGNIGAQALLGQTLFNLDQTESHRSRGLMWLTIARSQATRPSDSWIVEMQERYFSLADEAVRRRATAMADKWIEHNKTRMADAAN